MIVLFVCKANIVRSYMAAGILKEKLRRAQKTDITVQSAGLMEEMHGSPADRTAEKIMEESGYPSAGHRARLLTRELADSADWIVVMENGQQASVLEIAPDAGSKLHLLKTFSRDYDCTNDAIRDPHGRSAYHYRLCFSEIYLSMDGLMKCILNTGN